MDFSHLLLEPNEDGLTRASEALSKGELIAFPTETVYGLGANALNEEAVLSIFTAKGRPLTDPLIVHVADAKAALKVVDIDDAEEKSLFEHLIHSCWPGPLTIIVKAASIIPAAITANTGYVGVRCPSHPISLKLLKACKLPIAAPSANKFGHVSPTTALHVLEDLGSKGVRVINGECEGATCELGIESTVIKLDSKASNGKKQINIFRQGGFTQEQLQHELNIFSAKTNNSWEIIAIQRAVKMSASSSNTVKESQSQSQSQDTVQNDKEQGQEAPGQAITHYSPYIACIIVNKLIDENHTQPLNDKLELINISDNKLKSSVVVIDFSKRLSKLENSCLAYKDLSASGNPSEAASNLFKVLRWAEAVSEAKQVLIANIISNEHNEGTPIRNISLGVADRIFRAASGVMVNLQIAS